MMRKMALRAFAFLVCLMMPVFAAADYANPTFLAKDDATHVEFTLGFGLHADGFPACDAHLSDWEEFLSHLSLSGYLNGQAFLEPESRVYMNAALCVDGEEKVPFIYDGYHSYRYLVSPLFLNESIHFQMHNFFDFMLKPYYFTELPTQYIALFLYPNATYFIADAYYTPVKELIESAREDALAGADTAADGLTYTIPYEQLYELCEGLDYITTDDDAYRVYSYFETLLAELYASYMVTDTLSSLETVLDVLDPEMEGMTVTETENGMTCVLGGNEIFVKTISGDVTEISLRLPVPLDYELTFDYTCTNTGDAEDVTAVAAVSYEGDLAVSMAVTGVGLPAEGALAGEGTFTVEMDGYVFEEAPKAQTFAFDWSRTAAELPYDLNLTVDWLHPDTGLPAFSVYFTGALSQTDKSVFAEGSYEQNDFFNLNDMYLQEYKERWAPTIGLYLLPVLLEMPAGAIDDTMNFLINKDILVSLLQ